MSAKVMEEAAGLCFIDDVLRVSAGPGRGGVGSGRNLTEKSLLVMKNLREKDAASLAFKEE